METMEISIDGFGRALATAINETVAGERERILKILKEDALIQTQIDITVLNYLVGVLEL
jgi:hypothetical protein